MKLTEQIDKLDSDFNNFKAKQQKRFNDAVEDKRKAMEEFEKKNSNDLLNLEKELIEEDLEALNELDTKKRALLDEADKKLEQQVNLETNEVQTFKSYVSDGLTDTQITKKYTETELIKIGELLKIKMTKTGSEITKVKAIRKVLN